MLGIAFIVTKIVTIVKCIFLTKREMDRERKKKIAFLVYRVLKSGCSLVENKNPCPPLPNPKSTCCNKKSPIFQTDISLTVISLFVKL